MTVRFSEEEKEQYLSQWKASGLSKAAYCQQENLNIATFYYWLARKNKSAKHDLSMTPPAFIPARLTLPTENITVNVSGGITISCQIAQLPQVIQALKIC